MKKFAILPAVLAALPAQAHEAGHLPATHAHPHGIEAVVLAAVGLALVGYMLWKTNRQN